MFGATRLRETLCIRDVCSKAELFGMFGDLLGSEMAVCADLATDLLAGITRKTARDIKDMFDITAPNHQGSLRTRRATGLTVVAQRFGERGLRQKHTQITRTCTQVARRQEQTTLVLHHTRHRWGHLHQTDRPISAHKMRLER